MSKLNLQINVPFIVEQNTKNHSGQCNKERHAFVILDEYRKLELTSDNFPNGHCGYRLADLTLGCLRAPLFRTVDEVEQYIERRANWTIIQENLEYGFETEYSDKENER